MIAIPAWLLIVIGIACFACGFALAVWLAPGSVELDADDDEDDDGYQRLPDYMLERLGYGHLTKKKDADH